MKNLYHFLLGTLRGRLIIGVAAVHAVMMALFVGDLTVRQRTMLLDHQTEGAAALSQALATSAAGWIAANDISGLQELAEAQRRYPEILFVILANEEGRVLAGSDKSRQGLYMLDLPREARQTVFSRTPALVDIAVPAMIGGRHVGWARVGIGQTAADEKLAEITRSGVVYALAAILIGSVIAWFMGRWITRRLYAVQRTIDAVRSGNRLARSSLAGTDEAAVMAQEFNSMLDALAAQDEKLSAGEKRYRSLIYKVQTAIVLHDGQGRILNSNPLAQELLGLSADQLLGKSLIDPEWHFLREDGSVLPVAEYPVSLVLSTRQPLRGHVTGIICPERHHVAWVLVNAEPEYDDAGEIALVIVSFVDITGRKRAEQERLSNLRFFERMDRVNRAIQGARDVDSMMSDVLDVALSIFDCDRAWLFYPCDPDARSFRVPMEITKPEYPGAKILNVDLPMPPDMAQNLREALESVGPVTYTAGTGKPINKVSADQFGVESMMMVALHPKSGKPWAFGLHQCSYPRVWTSEEERLFQETGRRLADALTGLLMQRNLQESENRYRRITEGLTDYQYSVRIEHDRPVETTQSPTCAIVTGYTPEEFAADPYLWIHMVAPDDRELVRERVQQILAGNEMPPFEHRICRKDGRTCWVSDTIILFKDTSGKLLSYDGVIKDITERKLAEEKLHRLNRELRAVGNCNQVLVRAEDEQTLLNNICRIICDEAGYRMAWVGYAENDEAKTIRPVAWAGAEDGYLEQARLTWADTERGRGTSGTAIRSGESTCIQDFTSDPRAVPWRDSALQRGYRSGIALPLKDESERTFGVLNIYSTEPNAFTPDEIRLLEELAGDLAFGIMVLRARIERRRVENIMQARLRLLEFAGSHSMDELLTATLDEIEALTGSVIGFYHFVESDQKTLSLQSWSTNTLKNMCTAEGKGSHYDIDQAGVWVDCVHERRPVIHNDYDSLPHRKGMPEGHAPVIREVVVPIYRGTQIRAIIGVGNKSANYVPSDIEIVSQLGDLSWDITERKRAEEELRRYREHLEDLVRDRTEELEKRTQQLETANIHLREADRLKSVFLASMSHELRTPLNSIIGFTGIMLMGMAGDLNEEQRRQLAMVKSSANHLLGLINDVLDIAKIEAGRVTLSRECFKLEDVVDSVFETLLPMATEKGLELVRDIQSEIALVSDKRRIKQILINIAGNAITFTDRGHVRISARALGEDKLELRFTDTGIGIRQEDINRLFSPFQQIDMSLTKAHEGTGLGLYLCKRLAILLGGDVGVTSTYGKGSEFTVVLPLNYGGAYEKDTDR